MVAITLELMRVASYTNVLPSALTSPHDRPDAVYLPSSSGLRFSGTNFGSPSTHCDFQKTVQAAVVTKSPVCFARPISVIVVFELVAHRQDRHVSCILDLVQGHETGAAEGNQ